MNIINNKLQFEERMGKTNWREKVIYALYIFAILNMVSSEQIQSLNFHFNYSNYYYNI